MTTDKTESLAVVLRASSAARYAACPASWHREQGLPDRDIAPEIRATGERGHAYIAASLAGETALSDGLTDEDISTADYLISRALAVLAEHGNVGEWLMLDDAAPLVGFGWSGHPDAAALAQDNSLHVCDWKFGWLDVPDADLNLQLRVYAVLLYMLHKPEKIYCHIIGRTGTTSALYLPRDIEDAAGEMGKIYDNVSAARNANGNPGPDQCRYCRAFCTARCPETCAIIPTAAKSLPTAAQIGALPAADVARSLPLLEMVKAAIKALEARAKALLAEDPQAFGGTWVLKEGNAPKVITNAVAAYIRTGKLMSESAFISACKVSRPALIDKLTELRIEAHEKYGDRREKFTKKAAKEQATLEIDEALGDCVETKQNAPSLKFCGEKQITGE